VLLSERFASLTDRARLSSRYVRGGRDPLRALALQLRVLVVGEAVATFDMPTQPRSLWASNRLCEAVTLHRTQAKHRQAVRDVKPMIDNRDPRRPRTANSKGARLEAERNAQIMHENTILLNKLSRILTRDAEPPRALLAARGLNDPQRRIEREKIDRDNLMLLRRLQYAKPSVSTDNEMMLAGAHLAMSRKFAANPFLLDGGPLPAGSGTAAVRRRPRSAPVGKEEREGAAGLLEESTAQVSVHTEEFEELHSEAEDMVGELK